jgi:curved DNA-binding protein CbpA
MAEYTEPQYWPQLKSLAQTIDGLDYFQILNLPTTASGQQIRTAYYSLARALHPDKFYHIQEQDLKSAVNKIYKRVTEAYTVLKDEPKRIQYLKDIQGPERAKKLRFNEQAEQEQKEQQRAAAKVAKTPKGEQMYNAALVAQQNGKLDEAFKAMQSAVLLEPGNPELKRLLGELDKKRKGG